MTPYRPIYLGAGRISGRLLFDSAVNKVVLTRDGDVQELNDAGAIVWTLLGSQILYHYILLDPRDSVPELCKPR
jgi:hypothetical protein